MVPELSIGRLADQAGVNVETIRYYQRRGLLDVPARPPQGHRRYPVQWVKRVRFVKRAQALGFTLTEITGLLDLDAKHACAETLELAARKLQLIDAKLADLRAMRRALATSMSECDPINEAGACPLIQSLASD